MRVLVCGGRNFSDRVKLEKVLAEKIGYAGHQDLPRDTVIVGGASGSDTMAENWAHCAGHRVQRFLPDWKRFGRAAGPKRNQQMLDEGKPTLVIAFPGGRGTSDMIARAIKTGISVYQVL